MDGDVPRACLAFLSFLADNHSAFTDEHFVPQITYDSAVLNLCRARKWADCEFSPEGFPLSFTLHDAGRAIAAEYYLKGCGVGRHQRWASTLALDVIHEFISCHGSELINMRITEGRLLTPGEAASYRESVLGIRQTAVGIHMLLDESFPGRGQKIEDALQQFCDNLLRYAIEGMIRETWELPQTMWSELISADQRALLHLFSWASRGSCMLPGASGCGEAGDTIASQPQERMPRENSERPWRQRRLGGAPIRGWDEICEAIGVKNSRSRRENMKRLNNATDGPISWCGDVPEADRGELVAWIEDTKGRAEAMGEIRNEQKKATQDLGEREGARAQDYGAQVKPPHGKRGKAKG